MKKASILGFTLVEIMVVMAVIMVLASLAIPGIMRSRITAMEMTALANIRTIRNSSDVYYVDHEAYPDSLLGLANTTPPYLEPKLASGIKQGYEFIYGLGSGGFTVQANPSGLIKGRYFFSDEKGLIHYNDSQPAGPEDAVFR